jgi:hypothetical protein
MQANSYPYAFFLEDMEQRHLADWNRLCYAYWKREVKTTGRDRYGIQWTY